MLDFVDITTCKSNEKKISHTYSISGIINLMYGTDSRSQQWCEMRMADMILTHACIFINNYKRSSILLNINQGLSSSVTSMAAVVSTSAVEKVLIVLYFLLLPSLFDFSGNDNVRVADEAFSFRVSIIELLEILRCVLGDLPPLNVSSFSAKSIIGLKFLSVSFRDMVPFSIPTTYGLYPLRRESIFFRVL